jgi:hypothetical protein
MVQALLLPEIAAEHAALDAALRSDGKPLAKIEASHCRQALVQATARALRHQWQGRSALDGSLTAASGGGGGGDAAEDLQAWMPTASLGVLL